MLIPNDTLIQRFHLLLSHYKDILKVEPHITPDFIKNTLDDNIPFGEVNGVIIPLIDIQELDWLSTEQGVELLKRNGFNVEDDKLNTLEYFKGSSGVCN